MGTISKTPLKSTMTSPKKTCASRPDSEPEKTNCLATPKMSVSLSNTCEETAPMEKSRETSTSSGTETPTCRPDLSGLDSVSRINARDKRIRKLEEEVVHLKKKVKRMEEKVSQVLDRINGDKFGSSSPPSSAASTPALSSADSTPAPPSTSSALALPSATALPEESEILQKISHMSDSSQQMKTACLTVFSTEQLTNCSRTGKKTAKCVNAPRPALCQKSIELVEKVMMTKGMSRETFHKKFENMQKVLRRGAAKK